MGIKVTDIRVSKDQHKVYVRVGFSSSRMVGTNQHTFMFDKEHVYTTGLIACMYQRRFAMNSGKLKSLAAQTIKHLELRKEREA